MHKPVELDLVIFGGGGAGLWLLDQAVSAGYRVVLLEASALGSGQTIASQGIIHGGVKYSLAGMVTAATRSIRAMPGIWRACLAGERRPDLRETQVRADCCYLWRTRTLRSRVGFAAAKAVLQTAPVVLREEDWPGVLRDCPGTVLRVDEQVIDTRSFVADLARQHAARILKYDTTAFEFELDGAGTIARIRLGTARAKAGADGELLLVPRQVVFSAGAGNGLLRERAGLAAEMQLRPLHMVLLRAPELPELHGHCIDGAETRVTVTSARLADGGWVWQIGGHVSEQDVGVRMESRELCAHARAELQATIPGLMLNGAAWATYRVERAEPRTAGGGRPNDAWCRREGNVITAWPTKLALAPRLADDAVKLLTPPASEALDLTEFESCPRPEVGPYPWEQDREWYRDV